MKKTDTLLSKISRRFTASLARGTTQNKTTRGGGACSSVSFGRLCRLHTFLSLSLSFSYESIGLSSLSSRPRRLSVNCVWWRCLSVAFNRSFSKHTFFLGVPQRNGSERKCLKVESGDRRIWGNNLFRTYKNNSFLRRHKYRRWNAPSPIFSSNLPLFKNRRPLKFEKRTRDV